ncbi:NAD(P)H-dependent flavin oxidoreductase [Gallaecimonas mangrovi]|uniref:NAD(P)H-dependent flavin oxidoreductase n=1 Tax=Gallaecimonas mangrovi TaxID=2291597 RepID=UPI000E20AD3E|nr:nitronate monooxygenase [Gallaecimonas mangrovi]
MKMSLLARLGVTFPLLQAPMAGVSTPALAAAVSNAGGLGALGLGASSADKARQLIKETRALTDKPFNVNLFCHQPASSDRLREAAWLAHLAPYFAEFGAKPPEQINEIYQSFVVDDAMLKLLLDEKPAVVSFHFGLPPQSAIAALKAAGIVLLASATNLAEAKHIEAAGLDAIVAQGVEAGGHRGVFDPERDDEIGTLALVRLLSQHCTLPIIAAGGIMDGLAIQAAMTAGAGAVQLGTAFILCPESAADANYRAALKSDKALHTAITANISGRPARGLPNRFYSAIADNAPVLPAYPNTYDAGKALAAAAKAKGVDDFAAQWAGQGAPLARELPAGELVKVLMAELVVARKGD